MQMMKIFPLLLLLILGSCGFKTPPTPYPSISEGLLKIQQEKIYFEGDQLVLEWTAPEGKPLKPKQQSIRKEKDHTKSTTEKKDPSNIYLYHLKVMTPGTCPVCEDQLLEKIQILHLQSFPNNNPEGIQVHKNENNAFKVIIPSNYLSKFNQSPLVYFSIDYYTIYGELSPTSGKLYPKRPVLIPVPDIKWKIIISNALQPKATIENETPLSVKETSSLLINWEPVLEKEVHVIQSNGKLKFINLYYGLILFTININDKEEWIIPKPLYDGQYQILDANRQIWAKHLDRFGNYSQKTLIYTP